MSTNQIQRPPARTPRESKPWLGRAWTAIALVPVFFFIAFAVGEGLYALMATNPKTPMPPSGWTWSRSSQSSWSS